MNEVLDEPELPDGNEVLDGPELHAGNEVLDDAHLGLTMLWDELDFVVKMKPTFLDTKYVLHRYIVDFNSVLRDDSRRAMQ